MGYALEASWVRAVIAAIFALIGSIALGAVTAARAGMLSAATVVTMFATVCWLAWHIDQARQPIALRLMGGRDAVLYFSTRIALRATSGSFSRVLPRVLQRLFSRLFFRLFFHFPCVYSSDVSANTVPPMAVRIDRVRVWPGRLLSIVVTPQRPPGRAFAVLILADSLPHPRFRALAAQLSCVQRGVTLIQHR